MLNINNVAKFITFFPDGKKQLNFAHVLIKMHPTTDQNMEKKQCWFRILMNTLWYL